MKYRSKSFTLIELLIVIGILAVLVTTILITLNPAEAQKKARDTKRMKDVFTLEAVIQQHLNDGNSPFCTDVGGCSTATSPSGSGNDPCGGSHWIRTIGNAVPPSSVVNLCNYTKTIPYDPTNKVNRTYVYSTSVGGAALLSNPESFLYRIKMEGSDYEINVRQESRSNIANVTNDGGNSLRWVEKGSKLDLLDD